MPISYLRRTAAVAAVAAGPLTFLGAPAGAQSDPCYTQTVTNASGASPRPARTEGRWPG